MASRSAAASATVREMGPLVEKPARSGMIGPEEIRPRLGLMPYSPQAEAGMRIEPAPSLPCATGASPPAAAAAAPPRDPPAERETVQGVVAGGPAAGPVEPGRPTSGGWD